jgi:transcriptional regulator with XRE-family HTH domain
MQKLTFGEKLILLRKKKKVSQRQLGKALGINYSNFPKYENDEHFPSAEILIKLSNFFDVSIDYLLRDKNIEDDFSAIQDRRVFDKIKDLDTLSEQDRNSIFNIIDGMISKHKLSGESS